MGRAPCCEKVGLKRGRWTAEEDEILKNYIEANGEGSWRSLPKNAGLLRCGKSCRLRWINYLRSDLKRGNITPAEEEIIINLHATLGNRWSVISGYLPGRTDNEIKNYWNSHLSRRIHSFIRRPDPHFTLPPEKEKKNKNKNKNKKKKLDIDKTRPTTLLEKGTDDNNNNNKIVAVSDEPEMDLDSLMEDLSEIWTEMEIGGTMTSSENDWNMCWGEEAEPAAPWSGDMEEQLAEDQNRVLSSNYDYYNFENQVGPLHHDHNQFISWLFS